MKRTTTVVYPLTTRRVEKLMGENVRLGLIEVFGVDGGGEPVYKITPEGEAHVRDLLGGDAA